MQNYQVDPAHSFKPRSLTQKICIGIGIVFIFLGAVGLLYNEFAGGHFSLTMNFLHLISGLISFFIGVSKKNIHAYWFSIVGFIFMALLTLGGFILGSPGVPSVGFQAEDPFHFVLIPRLIELGLVDHLINAALAVAFLLAMVSHRKFNKSKMVKTFRRVSKTKLDNTLG